MRKNFSRNHNASYKHRFFSLLLIPLAFLIKWLMSLSPEFTEKYYSQGIYKFIMQPVSRLTGLVPFSVAEIFAILLVLYIPARIVYLIIHAARARKWSVFLPWISNMVFIVSLVFFLQTILWTIHYERLPFADSSGLEVRDSSVDELEALCRVLIEDTNLLREQVTEDENGVMKLDGGFKKMAAQAELGYDEIQKHYSFLAGTYGPPKPVLLSRAMSHTNIIGIYISFTGEANIDIDIPDSEIPSTAMHEMAHQRGFAREDEANFIAYLTCMAHPDASFKYSGSVLALQHSMNALYIADSTRYFDMIKLYSPGYLRDLEYQHAYWKQFQGAAKDVVDKINDSYLKFNGETDGVKSYGRMVDLLLAYHRQGAL